MTVFSKQQNQEVVWGLLLKREPLPVSDFLLKAYPLILKVRSAGCLRGQNQLGPRQKFQHLSQQPLTS